MAEPVLTTPRPSIARVAITTATQVAVIGVMLALYSVRDLLLLFFVGVVVAAALHPLVAFLERYRVPKGLAVVLIYLAFIGALVAGAALVAPTLVSEATAFFAQAPTRYQEARTTLQSSDSGPLATLGNALPLPEEAMRFVSQLGSLVSSRTLVDVASAAASVVTTLLTVLAVAFYWTIDQARMERLWLSLAPPPKRPELLAVWRDMETKMGSYLGGTTLLGVIIALVTGAGYAVMGLRYAVVLGVLAGLGEFIPIGGFIIGLVPAVLVGLTVSPQLALLVIVWNLIVQTLENALLVPRVMSSAVGVSPLVVLFALLIFSSLFGVGGAFLAIPIAAIIQVLLDYLLLKGNTGSENITPDSTPLAAARLALGTLRQRVRARMRESGGNLDVETGLDAVDHRIETIVDSVDQAIAAGSRDVTRMERDVVTQIEQGVAQVDALLDEVNDEESLVGVSPKMAAAQPEVAGEMQQVIRETRQALTEAAADVRDVIDEASRESPRR